ncbi:MAG TPA: hypothetical protein VK388_18865 [Pyrinomonadaceae bacterium]|nr:hypothetical protein [Pyrinomonadaceae bacterium]
MNRQRLQSLLLRAAGSVEILAFVAVLMPRSWMESSHAWLGLGEMPRGAVLMYMIRQASYVYGMHGILMWILASDVVRYRPPIRFTGITFLVAAPVFLVIDHTAGMPLYWTLLEAAGCAFFGATLLWLTRDHAGGSE